MNSVTLPTLTDLHLEHAHGLNRANVPDAEIDGLYVHVPFCFHKCHYCDFYSITRQTPERMERFVELVLRELAAWTESRPTRSFRPRSIFFGGGTPSLLPEPFMRRLIEGLRESLDLSCVTEWTIECNPATVSSGYLTMLRSLGVNRLSFGAQSFDPAELLALERHHAPADVSTSIQAAKDAGFCRLNLDLIYAIPGQSLDSWKRSLDAAIALDTPHLSCYGLTYEPNTPMGVKKRLGQLTAAEESLELAMLHHTRERLSALGYEAYEISNYAQPGEPCRHNLMYWSGGNYLGVGPSAASHIDGTRWRNRPHLGEWEQAVQSDELPATDVERLTQAQRNGETAMLMLRLSGGINFADYAGRSGCDVRVDFREPVLRLEQLGLISVDADAIRLTESGINVADAVSAEFL